MTRNEVSMATANLISLTSALLGAGTGEVLKNGIQVLAERVKFAQNTYQLTLGQSDDPVQNLRHDVIHKINELRNRAALCISDPDFQQKVWCLLMEQMADAYETNTERGLNLVQYSAGQIEDVLNSYKQANGYRRKARWIGVVVSLLSLAGIGCFLRFADTTNLNGDTAPPILGVPWCVLFWSFVGSFAAILYRFTNAGDQELEDPLRWLFSRPLTGVVMGSITYLVIEAGFLTLGTQAGGAALGKNDLMLLLAFLAGFSDRFADSLLQSLVGRFGGEKNGELVAMGMGLRQPSGSILDHLTAVVNRGKNTPVPAPLPGVDGGGRAATLAVVEKSDRGVASIAQ
jgi:hypothetical protein